jgi:pyrimidine-specific ribonucleoside hydrolase
MFLSEFKLLFFFLFIGMMNISQRCFSDGLHGKSVIIDTDMGLDDARSLAWFFNMHNIHIEGIITSDGALDPLSALKNLRITLAYFHKQEIPVCEGTHLRQPDPPFRPTVESAFASFPEPDNECKIQEKQLFYKTITDSLEDHSLIYVCLGPLSNLAYAIDSVPGFTDKIKKVLYAGNNPDQNEVAWNTARDNVAAYKVFSSLGNIYEFHISREPDNFFKDSIIREILESNNDVASFYRQIHNLNTVSNVNKRHLFLYDDMVALYFQYPELCNLKLTDTGKSLLDFNKDLLQSVYTDFIQSGNLLSPRPDVVFKQYPIDSAFFKEDVAAFSNEIIMNYGLEEWKAALLTNEMHRHLGTFSIAGVKMGIFAREILDADIDELSVVSYAGSDPPLSCFTDGLQIATGASLGRGTISNSTEEEKYPKALFTNGSRKILLVLKQELTDNIYSDINRISNQYGYGTSRYFEEIRKISIQYWVNLNRKYMFEAYDYLTGEKIF